ncbi:hypothetical protein WH50_15640 [Pokkaliibacter plantistimulans]|uniref:Probable nicotinate-nucleotide adenylyltransferase n=1 Tax=Pokkaliibacter plantistimulans TaxID=1635171 RepID=A0ABX5LYJ2_9GAMM|nr:nicotinate-nucleotide adenylyltransferase [Pokkaliibacter plantistimulans]PXF30366.1 hypothetical protein WH50_15640 [Pokkaliibacter plantistimulans]
MGKSVAESAIVLLGGTFDPVHNGHLRVAMELADALPEAQIRLLPCQQPVHKAATGADQHQRVAMLQLAITGEPQLLIDQQELQRQTPSYTVLTLEAMRQQVGNERSLCWVIGMDSLLSLPRWHRWQELLELANLIVVARPGWEWPSQGEVAEWLHGCAVHDMGAVPLAAHGQVLRLTMPTLDISATYIRNLIRLRRSARFLLPDAVWSYLQQQRLYGAEPM